MGVAPILAPLAGAELLAAFGWRALFVVLAAAAVAFAGAVGLLLPESLPPAARTTAGWRGALGGFRAALATVGVVLPNATALAMGLARRDAGGASAILGLFQSGCGAASAAAVTALADGTPRPMALVMLGCAIAAAVAAPPE
jgi:DHA1 family bicyclomycin/chloramphenicol resistance-like MFS transporter